MPTLKETAIAALGLVLLYFAAPIIVFASTIEIGALLYIIDQVRK